LRAFARGKSKSRRGVYAGQALDAEAGLRAERCVDGLRFGVDCKSMKRAMTASFSAGRIEQVTYNNEPPAANKAHAARMSLSCCAANLAMSVARRRA